MKSQYLLQQNDPYRCEIMIQALPDRYMDEMNNIDMILGQPLLFNYYTILDVFNGRIGFYKASYSKSLK